MSDETELAKAMLAIEYIKRDLKDLKDSSVQRSAFLPVQRLVYGVIGLVGSAIVLAVMGLIMERSQ